jgi:energy-coupling factor transporter ATP-binding protein EcfA2
MGQDPQTHAETPAEAAVEVDGLQYQYQNGHVALKGVSLRLAPDEKVALIGPPRVFDGVAFGPLYMGLPEDEVRRRVAEALAAVGMSGFEQRRPHELSIGERKRIAIATVLSMNPRLLALDEPSAGLDPRARRSLINLLAELPQAMIVSTHDMHLVRDLFTRTIVMDSGEIVADAPTHDVLSDVAFLEQHGLEGAGDHVR